MAKSRITFDKTEIVAVVVTSKSAMALHLTFDRIVSISFAKGKTKKFGFIPVESDAIYIRISGREDPITYYRAVEKEHFDTYLKGLEEFARRNRITFYNTLEAPAQ